MGFLIGGPFYDMIGRTGNNVGRRVRGKNVFSMRPRKSTKPATELQALQRNKLRTMASWLRHISNLVKIGFAAYRAEMSPMNAALSYNLQNAVKNVDGNFIIEFDKVLYSRGRLALPDMIGLDSLPQSKVKYSWEINAGDSNAKGTDKATFMVYDPQLLRFVVLEGGALRSALSFELRVPAEFKNHQVHCYISFVSSDGKMVSDSYYAGLITVL